MHDSGILIAKFEDIQPVDPRNDIIPSGQLLH